MKKPKGFFIPWWDFLVMISNKYLEHMKQKHPGKIPKTRGEFFKECLDKKYNSGGLNKC